MKHNLIILALLLVATALYTRYDDGTRQGTSTTPEKPGVADQRQTAPDFSFTSLTGKNISLSDFKGRPVVLNFWASWCAPCVIEFPQMLDLAAREKSAVFLFLSLDDDDAAMNRFIRKLGKSAKRSNIYIGKDIDKTISQNLYQTYKLPETYLITADGQIARKIIGSDVAWNGPSIARELTALSSPSR